MRFLFRAWMTCNRHAILAVAAWFVLACPPLAAQALAATVRAEAVEGRPAVRWPSFRVDDRAFAAGEARFARDGIWFAGVDLGNNQPLVLPRLGHRGWLPLARVRIADGRVAEVRALNLVLPASRLGRSQAILKKGTPLKVLVLGSSLLNASSGRTWPALTLSLAVRSPYRLPGTTYPRYAALQSASNVFQLAQLSPLAGLSGDGRLTAAPSQPSVIDDADLVIIGVLANGGPNWERAVLPIFTALRDAGVNVLVVTDNATIRTAAVPAADVLYDRGPRLIALAERFGFEVADTAAHVAAAQAAFPGSIYRDHIHMTEAGDAAIVPPAPSGQEVWARAVSSVFGLPAAGALSAAASSDPNGADNAPSAPDEVEHMLVPATAVAKAAASGVLAGHPWPKAIVVSPQRASSRALKVLRLGEGGGFTLRVPCLSSLHLVSYADAGTAAASVDLVGRDGALRRTALPGPRPFPNLWLQQLALPVPPSASADGIEIKVHGALALDSLLVGRAVNCR